MPQPEPCPNCGRGHHGFSPIDNIIPPRSDMVHSTFSPNGTDLANAAIQLEKIQREIDKYDAEIFKLRKLASSLEEQQYQLKTYAEQYVSISSPIRRLPNETLTEIFLHTIDSPGSDDSGLTDTLNSPSSLTAITIGVVCSRWRSIALSTKALWATFTFGIMQQYEGSTMECLELYLSRSGNAPISFTAGDGDWRFDDDAGLHEGLTRICPIMRRLCEEAHRWKEAVLLSEDIILPPSTAGPLRNLKALTVHERDRLPPDLQNKAYFADAPELRSLSIEFSPLPGHELTIPWSQLTDLTLIRRSSVAPLASILPKCTQLHTLRLEDSSGTYGGHPLAFISPLPALVHIKRLVFSRRSLHDISVLIAHLQFLHLVSINITRDKDSQPPRIFHENEIPIGPIVALLSMPDAPRLQVLNIEEVVLSDEPLIQLLAVTPALTELRFTCWQWGPGETIFERLTLSTKGYFTSPGSQPSNLIPKLSILGLAIYNAKVPVEDDLSEMLISRFEPSAILREVEGAKSLDSAVIECSVLYEQFMSSAHRMQDRAKGGYTFSWLNDRTLSFKRRARG